MVVLAWPKSVRAAEAALAEPVLPSLVNVQAIIVWCVIAGVTLTVLIRRGALSTANLRQVKRRSPDAVPWQMWLTFGLGLYVLLGLGATAGVGIAARFHFDSTSLASQAVSMWTGYAFGLIAMAVVLAMYRRAFFKAGIRAAPQDAIIGVGAYLLTLPIFMALLLIAAFVAELARGHGADPVAHQVLAELVSARRDWAWWAVVAAVVLAAPVVEEVIYRGCVQSALVTGTESHTIAILFTATIFALAHGSSVRMEALLGLFVLGLAFGLVFERTGRLGAAIAMHAVFNAASLVQALIASDAFRAGG